MAPKLRGRKPKIDPDLMALEVYSPPISSNRGPIRKRAASPEGVEPQFEVERVLNFRKKNYRIGGVKVLVPEYELKWLGYSHADNSWEPVDGIDAEELIKEYWERAESRRAEKEAWRTYNAEKRMAKNSGKPPQFPSTPIPPSSTSSSTSAAGTTSNNNIMGMGGMNHQMSMAQQMSMAGGYMNMGGHGQQGMYPPMLQQKVKGIKRKADTTTPQEFGDLYSSGSEGAGKISTGMESVRQIKKVNKDLLDNIQPIPITTTRSSCEDEDEQEKNLKVLQDQLHSFQAQLHLLFGGKKGASKCGKTGHFAKECNENDGGDRPEGGGGYGRSDRSDDSSCYNSNKTGHISRNCPEERRGGGGGTWAPTKCYNCGEAGHMSCDCGEAYGGGDPDDGTPFTVRNAGYSAEFELD